MAEVANSYIKEKEPEIYAFFLNYWDYLKKYYVVVNDDIWWGCFMSDLSLYVERYSDTDFFVDLIMALYDRNINDYQPHDIKYLSNFYKDWWKVLNDYHMPLSKHPEMQGGFIEAIQELYAKYKLDGFLTNCIDILYQYKMPDVKTADSLRFVEQIYGLV